MTHKARVNYIKAIGQQINRKKMYKAKKNWVVAGMSFLVLAGLSAMGINTHADTTTDNINNKTTQLLNSNSQNNDSNDRVTDLASNLHDKIMNNHTYTLGRVHTPSSANGNSAQSSITNSAISTKAQLASSTSVQSQAPVQNQSVQSKNTQAQEQNTKQVNNVQAQQKSSTPKSVSAVSIQSVSAQSNAPSNNLSRGRIRNNSADTQLDNNIKQTSTNTKNNQVKQPSTKTKSIADNIKDVHLSNHVNKPLMKVGLEHNIGDSSNNAQSKSSDRHWIYDNGKYINDMPNTDTISDGTYKGLTYKYDKTLKALEFTGGKLDWNGLNKVSDYTGSDSDGDSASTFLQDFSDFSNIASIKFDNNVNTSNVGSMVGMFSYLNELESLDLGNNFNTSRVHNMAFMFAGDMSLSSLILPNKFTTHNVIDMSSMFSSDHSLQSLTLPNSFDTSKVTGMCNMFNDTNLQFLNLSSFNTKNVSNMWNMFADNSDLKSINFGNHFNTFNVNNMSTMFNNDKSLIELHLPSEFNISNVKYMSGMFNNDTSLQKLVFPKSFNTSNVTDMIDLFGNDNMLQEIDISSPNTKFNRTSLIPKGAYVPDEMLTKWYRLGEPIIQTANLADGKSHVGKWGNVYLVAEYINFHDIYSDIDGMKNKVPQAIKIVGRPNKLRNVECPMGWVFVNNNGEYIGNTYPIKLKNMTKTLDIVPNTFVFATINYQYNGKNISTVSTSGMINTNIKSFIDKNIPNNYSLINGDNYTLKSKNNNVTVIIKPNQIAVHINYVDNGRVIKSTSPEGTPNTLYELEAEPLLKTSYRLVNSNHKPLLFDGSTQDVQVVNIPLAIANADSADVSKDQQSVNGLAYTPSDTASINNAKAGINAAAGAEANDDNFLKGVNSDTNAGQVTSYLDNAIEEANQANALYSGAANASASGKTQSLANSLNTQINNDIGSVNGRVNKDEIGLNSANTNANAALTSLKTEDARISANSNNAVNYSNALVSLNGRANKDESSIKNDEADIKKNAGNISTLTNDDSKLTQDASHLSGDVTSLSSEATSISSNSQSLANSLSSQDNSTATSVNNRISHDETNFNTNINKAITLANSTAGNNNTVVQSLSESENSRFNAVSSNANKAYSSLSTLVSTASSNNVSQFSNEITTTTNSLNNNISSLSTTDSSEALSYSNSLSLSIDSTSTAINSALNSANSYASNLNSSTSSWTNNAINSASSKVSSSVSSALSSATQYASNSISSLRISASSRASSYANSLSENISSLSSNVSYNTSSANQAIVNAKYLSYLEANHAQDAAQSYANSGLNSLSNHDDSITKSYAQSLSDGIDSESQALSSGLNHDKSYASSMASEVSSSASTAISSASSSASSAIRAGNSSANSEFVSTRASIIAVSSKANSELSSAVSVGTKYVSNSISSLRTSASSKASSYASSLSANMNGMNSKTTSIINHLSSFTSQGINTDAYLAGAEANHAQNNAESYTNGQVNSLSNSTNSTINYNTAILHKGIENNTDNIRRNSNKISDLTPHKVNMVITNIKQLKTGHTAYLHGVKLTKLHTRRHLHWIRFLRHTRLYTNLFNVGKNRDYSGTVSPHDRFTLRLKGIYLIHGRHHNALRFEVRLGHINYFITANHKFVRNAYLQKHNLRHAHKHHGHFYIRTIHHVYEYQGKHNYVDYIKCFKPHHKLAVKRIVHIGRRGYEQTRLELTNGDFITANLNYIKLI